MLDKDVYDIYFRIMNKKDKKLCDCTKGELLDVIKVIYSENQLLYKALDNACEELEELDKCHSYEINKQIVEKKGSSTITFGYQNKEEWKEWCMKDE